MPRFSALKARNPAKRERKGSTHQPEGIRCHQYTGNDLRVRSATAADIPAIMELERHTGAAAHWSREQYERMFGEKPNDFPHYVGLLIEDESAIQGFLVGHDHSDEWELQNVVVAAAAHRRGIGSQLLANFLEQARARGASAVCLEVRESNQAARAFYKKWRFREDGRRKGYYTEPLEDAILYSLHLS